MKTKQYIEIAILIFLAYSWALANDSNINADQEQKLIDVLQSDAKLFDKIQACRSLGQIATPGAVDVLASLLCDEFLGDYARFALEVIDGAAVDQVFREALDDCQTDMQVGLINSIGVRRDAKAVSQLRKFAQDPASRAAAQAIAALGRIATEQAIETILNTMNTGSETLRSEAAHACLSNAEQLLNMNDRPNALKLYTAVGKADVPKHLHAGAAYGEILARGSDGLPLLLEHLMSDDPAMIAAAISAARELPGNNITQRLAKQLPKLPPDTQVLLIKVMVDRNDPGATKSIQVLAVGDNQNVRVESLKALGQIGDVSAAVVLLKASDASGSEAVIARNSLRMLEGEGVDQAIIEHMNKTTPAVKAELIKILIDHRCSRILPELLIEGESTNPDLCREALRGLEIMAGPEYLPALIKLLMDQKNNDLRAYVEQATHQVAQRTLYPTKGINLLLAAFESSKDIETRNSLIRILGMTGDELAYHVIVKASTDQNSKIKDNAIRVLANWPDSLAEGRLLEIIKTSKNQRHRVLALRGYVRLLKQSDEPSDQIFGKYSQILPLANQADDIRLLLSGLAQLDNPEALHVSLQYIEDKQVSAEACIAIVQIAEAMKNKAKFMQIVIDTIQKVLKTCKDEELCKRAREVIRDIKVYENTNNL